MQGQIIHMNFSIDHTTHVLPQHGIMGEHGTLWAGLCATGVHNLQDIVAIESLRW